MNKHYISSLRTSLVAGVLALTSGFGLYAAEEVKRVTIAEWNFSQEYTVEAVEDEEKPNYSTYTPQSGVAFSTKQGGTWWNNLKPIFYPNDYTGSADACNLQIKTSHTWTLDASNHLYWNVGNMNNLAATDPYSKANIDSYNNYFEFNLSTDGFVAVNMNFSVKSNMNDCYFHVVYSLDEGETWTFVQKVAATNGQWTNYDVTLPSNEWSVKVRLIDFPESQQTWTRYLNQCKITGIESDGDFKMHTLTIAVSPETAGSVTNTPNGVEFIDSTEVSLTANENLGYKFDKWVDAAGNTVSTENPCKVVMTSDVNLTAVYKEASVYPFSLTIKNAKDYMVTTTSTKDPGEKDSVTYYEDGTTVTLTANSTDLMNFLYWDNGSTSLVRRVNITGATDVVANFGMSGNYIVGWDFTQPGGNDYVAAAGNEYNQESTLMLTTDGKTASGKWYDASVTTYNGASCVRVNKTFASNHYFQAHFSTKGCSNIGIYASIGAGSWGAWNFYFLEYSLDNENWKKVGDNAVMSVNHWTNHEVTLPAECNDQENVYVRVSHPEDAATLTENSYEEFCMRAFYVSASGVPAGDVAAPKLEASIPANQGTGAAITGSVILTFDEKVQMANGAYATLNGEKIKAKVAGNSMLFAYTLLDYATDYTFTVPANSIKDLSGNKYAEAININFTTEERTQPAPRLYDAVVAADGSGDYLTIQEAVDAAPASATEPYLIFVKAGKYYEHLAISKPYMHIIGQGRDVVDIYYNQLSGDTDNPEAVEPNAKPNSGMDGASVLVTAANVMFEGVSLSNSWGRDFKVGPQALALRSNCDRFIINKVGLHSYQDTWLTTSTDNYRHYAKDSYITGAVDFIYGKGNVLFENDTLDINRKDGGYITAAEHSATTTWGYAFVNNYITSTTFDPASVSVYFGRPWHNNPQVVFINTTTAVNIYPEGWYETMGGLPALYADYNTRDAAGNLVDTSKRQTTYYNSTDTVKDVQVSLSDAEAASYTLKNMLTGSDAWNPALITTACATPKVSASEGALVWPAVPYAICYVVENEVGEVAAITTERSFTPADADSKYTVRAANEFGGLSNKTVAVSLNSASGIDLVKAASAAAGDCYDLLGRKANANGRGFMIVNGRKAFK